MPVYSDPHDSHYQIEEVLPPKVYLCSGGGCSVTEWVSKRRGLLLDSNSDSSAMSGLTVNGAVVKGNSRASSWWDMAHTSINATGWERHRYEVFVPEGCTMDECAIKVKCNAQGSFRGTVSADNNSMAKGSASLTVCENTFPLELEVGPKLAPDQGQTHITAHASGDVENVQGDVKYDYESKKIAKNSDIEQLPNASIPSTRGCSDGTFELEAVTSVTMSADAGGTWWETESASMEADFENYIRTIAVICKCACVDSSSQTRPAPPLPRDQKKEGAPPEHSSGPSKEEKKVAEDQMKSLRSELENARKDERQSAEKFEKRSFEEILRLRIARQTKNTIDGVFTGTQLEQLRLLTPALETESQTGPPNEFIHTRAASRAKMLEWQIRQIEDGFVITGHPAKRGSE